MRVGPNPMTEVLIRTGRDTETEKRKPCEYRDTRGRTSCENEDRSWSNAFKEHQALSAATRRQERGTEEILLWSL